MNMVFLEGTVSRAPKMFRGDNWNMVAFSVQTVRKYEGKEFKEFHKVVAFNDVEAIQTLKEGDGVYVRGTIKSRKTKDKNGNEVWEKQVQAQAVYKALLSEVMTNWNEFAQAAPKQAEPVGIPF